MLALLVYVRRLPPRPLPWASPIELRSNSDVDSAECRPDDEGGAQPTGKTQLVAARHKARETTRAKIDTEGTNREKV